MLSKKVLVARKPRHYRALLVFENFANKVRLMGKFLELEK